MTPTQRQTQVLDAILFLADDRGFPPTIREVAARLKTLPSNVHQILSRLRAIGLVDWEDGKLRTLRVVK
jgi:DNA-binding IscR family transcriptional regulator